MPKVYTIA